MPNKYLVKLASGNAFANAITGAAKVVGTVVGAGTRVAGKGVKALGNQVHLATGGAYRDHAFKNLGVTDPAKLMKINGSQAGLREMARAAQKAKMPNAPSGTILGRSPELKADFRKGMKGLQNKQMDARIVVGGTAAAGAALTMKAKEKITERKNQGAYYQQY